MTRRTLGALASLVLVAACAAPLPEAPPGPTLAPSVDADALARAFHERANRAREAHGAAPVAWNEALAEAAEAHARDMARRGYFAHTSPEGLRVDVRAEAARGVCTRVQDGITRVRLGENLYRTARYERILVTTGPDGERRDVVWKRPRSLVEEVVRGWLGSPSHRANLLDAGHRLGGIGVATSDDDEMYVTQIFC